MFAVVTVAVKLVFFFLFELIEKKRGGLVFLIKYSCFFFLLFLNLTSTLLELFFSLVCLEALELKSY